MMMDVFIPEDYVRKRRLEKKLSAMASTKGSQTHSHWTSNERIKDTKELDGNIFFPSNSDRGLTPLVGDHLFIYFSA
jgi:hypothetical protein